MSTKSNEINTTKEILIYLLFIIMKIRDKKHRIQVEILQTLHTVTQITKKHQINFRINIASD